MSLSALDLCERVEEATEVGWCCRLACWPCTELHACDGPGESNTKSQRRLECNGGMQLEFDVTAELLGVGNPSEPGVGKNHT